jgi:hypothetical protein
MYLGACNTYEHAEQRRLIFREFLHQVRTPNIFKGNEQSKKMGRGINPRPLRVRKTLWLSDAARTGTFYAISLS